MFAFLSQPIGDIIVQSIGILGFGLFCLSVLFFVFNIVKENPSGCALVVIAIIGFSIVANSPTLTHGAAIGAGVAAYGIGAFFVALGAALVNPIFWLFIIAMVVASK